MREIKFRVWQPKIKSMCKVASFDCARNPAYWFQGLLSGYGGIPTTSTSINRKDEPDFILMQYTGLKDKDGKEIYEGDIIKHKTGLKDEYGKEYEWCSGTICFRMGGYFIKYPVGNGGIYRYLDSVEVEIIGNIYENPEILEKRNEQI